MWVESNDADPVEDHTVVPISRTSAAAIEQQLRAENTRLKEENVGLTRDVSVLVDGQRRQRKETEYWKGEAQSIDVVRHTLKWVRTTFAVLAFIGFLSVAIGMSAVALSASADSKAEKTLREAEKNSQISERNGHDLTRVIATASSLEAQINQNIRSRNTQYESLIASLDSLKQEIVILRSQGGSVNGDHSSKG